MLRRAAQHRRRVWLLLLALAAAALLLRLLPPARDVSLRRDAAVLSRRVAGGAGEEAVPPGLSPPAGGKGAVPAASPATTMLVTAASANHFEQLRNLVGSVHVHDPVREILVYDAGLFPWQLTEMATWSGVFVRRIPFDKLPPHVGNLYNMGFKIFAMDDALHHAVPSRCFFWMDAGVEVHRSLREEEADLFRRGAWFMLDEFQMMQYSAANTFQWLGVEPRSDKFRYKRILSTAVMGWCKSEGEHVPKGAIGYIFRMARKCMMDEACLAPRWQGHDTHSYDQSVFSMFVYPRDFPLHEGRRYFNSPVDAEPLPADRPWTLRRRWPPHAYGSHVVRLRAGEVQPRVKGALDALGREPGVLDLPHAHRRHPVVTCLRAAGNDRRRCAAQIRDFCRGCEFDSDHQCPRRRALNADLRRREECGGVTCAWVDACLLG